MRMATLWVERDEFHWAKLQDHWAIGQRVFGRAVEEPRHTFVFIQTTIVTEVETLVLDRRVGGELT